MSFEQKRFIFPTEGHFPALHQEVPWLFVTLKEFMEAMAQAAAQKRGMQLATSARLTVLAAHILVERHAYQRLFSVRDDVAALEGILQGGVSPADILAGFGENTRFLTHGRLTRNLELWRAIELESLSHRCVPMGKALQWAVEDIALSGGLLGPYEEVRELYVHYPLELTPVQIQIFKQAARAGMMLRIQLPVDLGNRGLALPAAEIAREFEKEENENIELSYTEIGNEGPLKSLLQTIFAKQVCEQIAQENINLCVTNSVTDEVNAIVKMVSSMPNARIAVGYRAFDGHEWILARALERAGISVYVESGKSLVYTPAAQLVLLYLQARLEADPQRRMRAIGRHPLNQRDPVSWLQKLPLQASLLDYVQFVQRLLGSFSGQQEALQLDAPLSDAANQTMHLQAFINWLTHHWEIQQAPVLPPLGSEQVYILPVSVLMGRQFDAVILPQMVHGKFPQAAASSGVLSDAERFAVNQLMKRSILKLQEEDPLESSPVVPRLAAEPMYFALAMAAAHQHVMLTASRLDASGKEQPISEFMQAVAWALGDEQEEGLRASSVPSALLEQAKQPVTMGDVPVVFKVPPSQMWAQFQEGLGFLPQHPLTPTRVEAFATCRFKGFVEKLLKVRVDDVVSYDVDPRITGQLAHAVLEGFFKERALAGVPATDFSPLERARLERCVVEQSQRFIKPQEHPKTEQGAMLFQDKQLAGHPLVFQAMLAWLHQALQRVVSTLCTDPPLPGASPVYFELAIGVGESPAFAAVPIQIADKQIYLGGVIDRVDVGTIGKVVIDYKLSPASAFSQRLSEKDMLVRHFQLPMYMRLLEHHLPGQEANLLGACLASIRDGAVSPVIGIDKQPELKKRICDDEAEGGFAHSLEKVMGPLLQGDIAAQPGEHCTYCRLARVCRLNAGYVQQEHP